MYNPHQVLDYAPFFPYAHSAITWGAVYKKIIRIKIIALSFLCGRANVNHTRDDY